MTVLDDALKALSERRFAVAIELAERATTMDLDEEWMYERGLPSDFTRPNRAKAYYLIGTAKSETGDETGAIASLDQALECNPKDGIAFSNRAVARRDLGDEQGALEDSAGRSTARPSTRTRARTGRDSSRRGASSRAPTRTTSCFS